MLNQLSKTLSTNVAIGGLALLVLGAGGASVSLAAAPSPNPGTSHSSQAPKADAADDAADNAADAAEDAAENGEGTRPTDTHGYCVSQVAKNAPTEPTGEGADKVTHGTLVSAAAHACGKDAKEAREANAKAEAKKANGKAYGKSHGTGRPATVTPGATAR